MSEFTSPQVVVRRQLDAYNTKKLDAWLATYPLRRSSLNGVASCWPLVMRKSARARRCGLRSRICTRDCSAELF